MFNVEELRNKCLLVSGATGMIASQIIKLLLRLSEEKGINIKIIALYRNETKKDRVFKKEGSDERISWLRGDVRDPISIDESVDYVIHAAGVTGGSKKHVDNPMDTIATALKGTINLLELAREKMVKGFVYLSSLEIYGQTDFKLATIRETDGGYIDPLSVRSSYSESKRMCETICAAYAKQYNVPAKVARLTATYGSGASYTDNRVLCEFARCVLEKKDIVLHSLGNTERNYCDVLDAANAILYVLVYGKAGEAYNIANMDTTISILDLAKRFIALYPEAGISLGYNLPENIETLGYNGTRKIHLDSGKLQALGWKPTTGIDDMIRNLVEAMYLDREGG